MFKEDWLVVLINPETKDKTVIVNDAEALEKYYKNNVNDIWVGYNSKNYDQYILKGILCGFNPKKINDWIIVKGRDGWEYSRAFNNIPLLNYDVMTSMHGLKQLEGFMGNNIKETSVDFNIDRKLTEDEIKETIKYCESDVMNTIEVFIRRIDEFNSIRDLIKTFDLPMSYVSKTKAQLSAIILGCEKVSRNDEWNVELIHTLRLKKYKHVAEWFMSNLGDYSKKLEIDVAGVPHVFGWGGLHGAKEKYHGKGLILHVDVNSFYPSIMIEYNLLTRNCKEPKKYEDIYNYRLQLKREGKKEEQAPYKIVLNATYGICKDKYSLAYDPLQANNVCINGQLLLLDLIEHLEDIKGFELIQSNTDGLIIKIPNTDSAFNQVDDICYEWEQRTRMGLGFDYIKEIYQKDVNNYVFIQEDGKIERKGLYVKELNELDNDLPIVNKALVDRMTKGISARDTIMACDDLKMFQQICKASSKYKYLVKCNIERQVIKPKEKVCNHCNHCDYGYCFKFNKRITDFKDICKYYDEHIISKTKLVNKEILNERTVRVFASKDKADGGLYKEHQNKTTLDKVASTPEHCFILNGDVNGVKVPSRLDKEWYIELAEKRLTDYGVI